MLVVLRCLRNWHESGRVRPLSCRARSRTRKELSIGESDSPLRAPFGSEANDTPVPGQSEREDQYQGRERRDGGIEHSLLLHLIFAKAHKLSRQRRRYLM